MSFSTLLPTTTSRLSPYFHLPRDLLKLSKYRLSALVALTAGAGYALRHEQPDQNSLQETNPPASPFWRPLAAVTAGTWLTAACANTLNQMYEIHSDALMARTRLRPLPAGRIKLVHAALFAAATGAAGLGLLAAETNQTATGIAAANIALYAAVYTPLKPLSTVNTWVGAVVGALPPMLGWAAASRGELTGERERGAWAFASLLFLWQIPHFHALAVVSRADYAAGGLKMLAVTDPVRNALWARITAAAMVPIGLTFSATGVTSPVFAWEAAALGMWMYKGAGRMAANPTTIAAAKPLFRASIFHLPVTMALLLAHHVPYEDSRQVLYDRQQQQQYTVQSRVAESEVRFHHPWEIMAPFPFLPVPMGVPAVVIERNDR